MLKYFADYIDEACKIRVGHDHWFFLKDYDREIFSSIEKECGLEVEEVIVILKEPDPLIEEEDGEK